VAATGTSLLDLHGIGASGSARLLVEVGDITRSDSLTTVLSDTGHTAALNSEMLTEALPASDAQSPRQVRPKVRTDQQDTHVPLLEPRLSRVVRTPGDTSVHRPPSEEGRSGARGNGDMTVAGRPRSSVSFDDPFAVTRRGTAIGSVPAPQAVRHCHAAQEGSCLWRGRGAQLRHGQEALERPGPSRSASNPTRGRLRGRT
jgi:hypothetical protein